MLGRVGLLALALVGCDGVHEYTIQVKDPRGVTIQGVPTPARLADGAPTIASGDYDDKPWAVVVFREDDGALRLRCKACNKDAFIVGPDGAMHVYDSRSPEQLGLLRPAPSDVEHGAFVAMPYSYCGFSSKHGCRGGKWTGTRITPWSNVAGVRDRRGASGLGSPLVLGGAIFLSGLGAAFVVSGLQSDAPAVQVLGTGVGIGLLTLSAVFVKLFVDGNTESVVLSRTP